MDITRPTSKRLHNPSRTVIKASSANAAPEQREEQTVVDYVSRGVGALGGALQVVLKAPRNSIAPFLLPARRANNEGEIDIPGLAKDPALTAPWGVASALGGAVFLGAVAGLCIGGPIAVAVGASVGANLFQFVDDKLADRARAEEKSPVFVDGALAKGESIDDGASGLGVWSKTFTTMTKSSYVEVRDWYSAKVKEKLAPDG